MNNDESLQVVATALGLKTTGSNWQENLNFLSSAIQDLIQHDFQKLVSILYRMDINESKLRALLQNNPEENAGLLIAQMMLERQVQKIKSREQFSRRDNDIEENEKW